MKSHDRQRCTRFRFCAAASLIEQCVGRFRVVRFHVSVEVDQAGVRTSAGFTELTCRLEGEQGAGDILADLVSLQEHLSEQRARLTEPELASLVERHNGRGQVFFGAESLRPQYSQMMTPDGILGLTRALVEGHRSARVASGPIGVVVHRHSSAGASVSGLTSGLVLTYLPVSS